jgi:hypothetical protein
VNYLLTPDFSGSKKCKKQLKKKTATPFKNSVVIGHWHKNAKVTAIKQQISKLKGNEKVRRKQLSS